MRVGLFGGSFDPIHQGHLRLAGAALRQVKLDRVYFIVSPRSPFKTQQKKTPARDRRRLVRIATRGVRAFKTVDWEMRRRGPSYTITTLRGYRRRRPQDELFLILGTDALKGLPKWRAPQEIARLVTFVGGRRPGAVWPLLPRNLNARFLRLKGVFPTVSSTAIRSALQAGRRPKGIAPIVHREIVRRGLYR